MRIKVPEFIELFDSEDKPFRVRFDYDEGEDQWFDARAGVGSPGYPASVEVTEVDFGNGWQTVENISPKVIEQAEQAIWEEIQKLEEVYWEGYAASQEEER